VLFYARRYIVCARCSPRHARITPPPLPLLLLLLLLLFF